MPGLSVLLLSSSPPLSALHPAGCPGVLLLPSSPPLSALHPAGDLLPSLLPSSGACVPPQAPGSLPRSAAASVVALSDIIFPPLVPSIAPLSPKLQAGDSPSSSLVLAARRCCCSYFKHLSKCVSVKKWLIKIRRRRISSTISYCPFHIAVPKEIVYFVDDITIDFCCFHLAGLNLI